MNQQEYITADNIDKYTDEQLIGRIAQVCSQSENITFTEGSFASYDIKFRIKFHGERNNRIVYDSHTVGIYRVRESFLPVMTMICEFLKQKGNCTEKS